MVDLIEVQQVDLVLETHLAHLPLKEVMVEVAKALQILVQQAVVVEAMQQAVVLLEQHLETAGVELHLPFLGHR